LATSEPARPRRGDSGRRTHRIRPGPGIDRGDRRGRLRDLDDQRRVVLVAQRDGDRARAAANLVILFHLFGGKVRRFSELERAIPAIT